MAMSFTVGSAAPQVRTPPDEPRYKAQEPGDKGEPDMKRPPDADIPEFADDRPEAPNRPGAPPFTGEDVEDVGRPRERDRRPIM
jgi:hypothetical protein